MVVASGGRMGRWQDAKKVCQAAMFGCGLPEIYIMNAI